MPTLLGIVTLIALVFFGGPAAAETVGIPGGMAAVTRLLGPIPEDSESFLVDLNLMLLSEIDPGHAWKQVGRRSRLAEYVADVAELAEERGTEIVIGAELDRERKWLANLAEDLGYKLKVRGGRIELRPREGARDARRRQLAQALDWDLLALERRPAGESTEFRIRSDQVALPVSISDWAALRDGRQMPEGRLVEMIRDQQVSLMIQARNRMSSETWEEVKSAADRSVAFPLFRYASAFEVRNGHVVVPGGDASKTIWEELTDSSLARPAEFLGALLRRKNARAAYLWHALRFVPDDNAAFYLGAGQPSPRFARKLYRRLDDAARVDFDHPRGGDAGFAAFVRSLPIHAGTGELELPGGLGLWFTAVKSAGAPADRASLERLTEKGLRRELDEGEFLQRVLTEEVDVLGAKRPVLPRLIRTVNMAPGRPELLTPELVVLAARASDALPLTLGVLHDLDFDDPGAARDYLLAVPHLDALLNTKDRELLMLNFQGGAEWLRVMAQAGKVDQGLLTRYLGAWGRLHHRVASAQQAAPAQLEWIADLVEELPAASDEDWGRGPLERALINALVEPAPRQRFSWLGVDYEGERGRDHARAMALRLELQAIPSADLLVGLAHGFEKLEAACESESLEEAKATARELSRVVSELPPVPLEFSRRLKDLAKRVFPTDREPISRLLAEVASVKKGKRLSGKVDEVLRARQLLAGELKAFLLAPSYLGAMRDEDSVLYDDPHLVRKHLAKEDLGADLITDNPWGKAEVLVEDESELGAHIRGHVAGVAAALAQFSGVSGGGANLVRDQLWFEDAVRTRWHTVGPELAELVHRLVGAGSWLVERAAQELRTGTAGSAVEFVASRVPLRRLERGLATGGQGVSRVAPSERLFLGLALLEADGFGSFAGDLPEDIRSSLEEAASAAGRSWREELDAIGVAAPDVNGSVRPRLAYLPPYEMLENETLPRALWQREMLDPKIAVVDFLGRHRMPGTIGADLMGFVLQDAGVRMPQTGPRDWEGHVRWVNQLDDDYFAARLRECLAAGLYTAQGF